MDAARARRGLAFALMVLAGASSAAGQGVAGYALRFHGNGSGDVDRVKIRLDAPARPLDVGGDFTLEFWMKALAAENGAPACAPGGYNWIYGNIVFDRDVYFDGDYGDYGVSLGSGRLAFGVARGADAQTVCGSTPLADGQWHHVAVTRRASDGQLRMFVDGLPEAQAAGPSGDVSYRDGRPSAYPNSDPFLVIGAEKHDAGPLYPSYSGWIDEVRVSSVVRYAAAFARPSAPFTTDAQTVALYHFDEGSGDAVSDVSGAAGGPSSGQRRFGGSPPGPEWVLSDAPLPVELQTFRAE
jgi:hypothetical protein